LDTHDTRGIGTCFDHVQEIDGAIGRDARHIGCDIRLAKWHGDLDSIVRADALEERSGLGQQQLPDGVVGVDDPPPFSVRVRGSRDPCGLGARVHAEGVPIAGRGAKLLATTASKRQIHNVRFRGVVLYAQTLGDRDGTCQNVDVVSLHELRRELLCLTRVAFRVDVDDLERMTVDAARCIGLLNNEVGANAHFGTFDGRHAGDVGHNTDLDWRRSRSCYWRTDHAPTESAGDDE